VVTNARKGEKLKNGKQKSQWGSRGMEDDVKSRAGDEKKYILNYTGGGGEAKVTGQGGQFEEECRGRHAQEVVKGPPEFGKGKKHDKEAAKKEGQRVLSLFSTPSRRNEKVRGLGRKGTEMIRVGGMHAEKIKTKPIW